MLIDKDLVKTYFDTYGTGITQEDFDNLYNYALGLFKSFTGFEEKILQVELKPMERIVFGERVITYSITTLEGTFYQTNVKDLITETGCKLVIGFNLSTSTQMSQKFAYWLYYVYQNVKDRLQGIKQMSKNVNGVSENTSYDINIVEKLDKIFKKDMFYFDCFAVIYRNDGRVEYV